MSNFKNQLNQLLANLNQGELSENDQAALKSSVVSILPLSERYERLFRTTEVDDLKEFSTRLESSEENDNRLTIKIQEHADRVFKDLESMSSTFEESVLSSFNKSRSELFITKMQLSIQENDIQMAKFYEERAGLSSFASSNNSEALTESTRVIYNSSLSLYNQKRYSDVIYFLNKAIGYLSNGSNSGSQESSRVEFSIHSLLIRACIEEKSNESIQVAEDSLLVMQEKQCNTLEFFKLSIKLINVKNGDPSEIEEVIMRMLMSNNFPMPDFKVILGVINDFALKDTTGAIKCFEYVFTNRLDPTIDHDTLEMILVAMINIYIKDKSLLPDHKQQNLVQFFDIAEKRFIKALSRKCSSGAITLLWNAGKSESKNNKFDESIGWFKLALHRLLQVNDIDRAKIQRAIQNSLINVDRYDDAIKIFQQMDDTEKKSLITQYNMFKVYSQKGEENKVMICLKEMTTSNEQNLIPLLSLCATSSNINTRIAIESMMLLFKNINVGLDSKVSIPSALRCVIGLILKNDTYKEEYLDTLLTLLQEAFKFAKDSKNIENYKFTMEELEWFSSQAFNISRECLINEDFIYGDLFAELSINLNSLIPDDTSFEKSINLKIWKFRAELISLLYVMIFQFEAELKLENYGSIESLIRESNKLKTIEFDSTLINMVINDDDSNYPDRIKSLIISSILSRNFGDLKISSLQISRWVRLLLKFTNGINEEDNCLKIISQIYTRLCSQEVS
ncbi:unnamed protein product [Wickerhamomyces anomalus]